MPLFVLPFIFVYDPALIMEGSAIEIMERIGLTLVAIWAITSAFESWIYKVGKIGFASRIVFAVGGILVILPELLTSLIGGHRPDHGDRRKSGFETSQARRLSNRLSSTQMERRLGTGKNKYPASGCQKVKHDRCPKPLQTRIVLKSQIV